MAGTFDTKCVPYNASNKRKASKNKIISGVAICKRNVAISQGTGIDVCHPVG